MQNAILCALAAVTSAVMAVYVLRREQGSPVQRLFAGALVVLGLESLFAALTVTATVPDTMVFYSRIRFVAMALVPGIWLAFSLAYARGNYREFLDRWQPWTRAAFVLPVGTVLLLWGGLAVAAARLEGTSTWLILVGRSGLLLHILFITGIIAVLTNLERTLRAAVGTMRWQIKFMVLGAAVYFGVRIYTASQALLYAVINPAMDGLNAAALILGEILFACALARGRLFSADLYPSHKFIYGSLTVFFAGAYLLAVGILAKAVSTLGGAAALQIKAFLIAVALLVLTVLILSEKVRQRMKRFVSTHFQRPQYDYRGVWTSFTTRTAHLTTPDDFCRAATRLVSDTFEALSATIWVVSDSGDRLVFGGSTALSQAQAAALSADAAPADFATILGALDYPVDIDKSGESWAAELKPFSPDFFKKGGNRICAALKAVGEPLGVLMIGDRVSGMPYTSEEFDLLKTIADQIAASLLNIRLSRRVAEAREMQAFQTMSAFFVHDLKNTASTLSLMLQNLPRHFDDPAFREDALRAIAKSVDRMNSLIRRLSALRKELTVRRAAVDLNALVHGTVKSLALPGAIEVVFRPGDLPSAQVDAGQIETVITNLVLNARDAVGDKGRIEIETTVQDGRAVLAVRDNGCGMDPEFVERGLFAPFRTTKKDGLGIGMFHTRMIVEAHGGRVMVESLAGQGSTFRILLPMNGGTIEAPSADR